MTFCASFVKVVCTFCVQSCLRAVIRGCGSLRTECVCCVKENVRLCIVLRGYRIVCLCESMQSLSLSSVGLVMAVPLCTLHSDPQGSCAEKKL